MWNVKYMITPVITGTTGVVTKGLKKSLEAVTGKPSTYSLQKTTTGYFECHTQYGKYSSLQIKI
jgi:hypothetical protein